jgi:hypothetical protein
MKAPVLISAALLAAASAVALPAAAMPGSGPVLAKAPAAQDSAVEKAHGWHKRCRLGRWGWHRHSWRWGRVPCRPPWWY